MSLRLKYSYRIVGLTLLVLIGVMATDDRQALSDRQPGPLQGATSKQARGRAIVEWIEKARPTFSKGRHMLLKKAVPFNPEMLLRPRWRSALARTFDAMPEMRQVRTLEKKPQGVYLGDTLVLPEEVEATGDLFVLARHVVHEGENPVIRAKGGIYFFVIESQRRRVKVSRSGPHSLSEIGLGMLRLIGLHRGSGFSSGFAYMQGGGCTFSTYPGVPGPPGDNGPSIPAQTSVPLPASKGAGGTCAPGDENGKAGDTGATGDPGVDASGQAGRGGRGFGANSIVCNIPDGTSGPFNFDARGGEGGKGGTGSTGGQGGKGGQGGQGGTGASCCPRTRGSGGDGGQGGRGGIGGIGGKGGPGGPGGPGGSITASLPAGSSYTWINTGGPPGRGGDPGMPGPGGPGGDPGAPGEAGDGFCNIGARRGGNLGLGTDGPQGFSTGDRGDDGTENGTDGPAPNITVRGSGNEQDDDGDGFSEDDGDCDDTNVLIYPNSDANWCGTRDPGGDWDCNLEPDWCASPESPVIVDLAGQGIDLTDASGGVNFDLNGDGVRERLGWTLANSDDAFLALDRNGNGVIDDGSELFGNYTPLVTGGRASNGFEALAEYDLPANGGDGNEFVDAGDAAYSRLRLWRDLNHNGVSESDELLPLSAAGIARIDVEYKESARRDRHGNRFRYRAKVFRSGENSSAQQRFAYDVFLVAG